MPSASTEVFTIGFAGRSAEQFFSALADARIRLVVDVRLHNRSQLAGYTKQKDLEYFLRQLVGAAYLHVAAFAPTKELLDGYRKGLIPWQQYQQRYRVLIEQRKPADSLDHDALDHSCLLCAEASADRCHRRLAAEYLQRLLPGIVITHL